MTFHSYPEMANSTVKWRTEYEHEQMFKNTDWIVTEKIHGANFSFIVQNSGDLGNSAETSANAEIPDGVFCAKRTAILKEDENFFHWQKMRAKCGSSVVRAFQLAKEKIPDISRIHIFGEIFGGKYPHPDVAPVKGVKPVQAGIYYSPDVHFCAFDLGYKIGSGETEKSENQDLVDDEIDPDVNDKPWIKFMDWDDFEAIMTDSGIPCAEILYRGPMGEALNYEYKFLTTVPRRFGLPQIEENYAEGIVVRPVKEIVLKHHARSLVKKKIEAFSEINKNQRTNRQSKKPDFDPEDQKLANMDYEIQARVTENRLDATISKVGPIQEKTNFKPIIDLFVADVIKDTAEDMEDVWKELDENEKKILTKRATDQCRRMMIWKKQKEP